MPCFSPNKPVLEAEHLVVTAVDVLTAADNVPGAQRRLPHPCLHRRLPGNVASPGPRSRAQEPPLGRRFKGQVCSCPTGLSQTLGQSWHSGHEGIPGKPRVGSAQPVTARSQRAARSSSAWTDTAVSSWCWSHHTCWSQRQGQARGQPAHGVYWHAPTSWGKSRLWQSFQSTVLGVVWG